MKSQASRVRRISSSAPSPGNRSGVRAMELRSRAPRSTERCRIQHRAQTPHVHARGQRSRQAQLDRSPSTISTAQSGAGDLFRDSAHTYAELKKLYDVRRRHRRRERASGFALLSHPPDRRAVGHSYSRDQVRGLVVYLRVERRDSGHRKKTATAGGYLENPKDSAPDSDCCLKT